jgi:hypothetical protein
MKRKRTIRKKKKWMASKCSKKEATRNFLRLGANEDFATEKIEDTDVDEKTCFFFVSAPIFQAI